MSTWYAHHRLGRQQMIDLLVKNDDLVSWSRSGPGGAHTMYERTTESIPMKWDQSRVGFEREFANVTDDGEEDQEIRLEELQGYIPQQSLQGTCIHTVASVLVWTQAEAEEAKGRSKQYHTDTIRNPPVFSPRLSQVWGLSHLESLSHRTY